MIILPQFDMWIVFQVVSYDYGYVELCTDVTLLLYL